MEILKIIFRKYCVDVNRMPLKNPNKVPYEAPKNKQDLYKNMDCSKYF